MIVALILWGYALVLATLGVLTLRRAAWVDRAPRLAIAAWQALTASIVLAVVFGGLALVVPTAQVSANLAQLVEACAMALQEQYGTPGGAALATGGLALAVVVVGRWVHCALIEFSRSAAVRRRHLEVLAVVGRREPGLGVTLLEDGRPFVYCLAGRRHQIVMTTAASSMLDEVQVAAVLAHEHAHLRGRHHLAISAAAALVRAFPWLPAFAVARREITRLIELVADDHATRSSHRHSLAEAMLTLATGAAPAGALAASDSDAVTRVRRLIAGYRPLTTWARTVAVTAAVTLVAAPALVLAAPAVTAGPDCCTADQPAAMAAEHCSAEGRHPECATATGD